MKKRIFSLFMSLIMVLSLAVVMPAVTVVAAGGVKSKLDSFISRYPSGSRWTSSFDGGKQCYGFAKLVIYNIFGASNSGGYTYRTWRYNGTPTSGMEVVGSITSYSSSNVKSLLSKAKCGDVLQFDSTKQHSMIIYSIESDGVRIYDCNWDNNCGISLRKCSFGAWSGRNSNKLTLLRSNNYSSIDGVAHTVNSNYSKNFTAYPKAKITASNIFDANHNKISSTAWIGTSDKCTVHEVYTDGCCKVTYPLSSGGTKTVYSKISLFNPKHTHSYNTYVYYEAAHPHYKCYKCSCGDVQRRTSETTYVSTCSSCTATNKHKVNTSYGKNFTAYPKAKITASNIFNEKHSQISSTAWIGTSDKCTIHEVYTDGCCKVTYPLSSGGTKTVYSKISLFKTHTHNYTGQRVYESAHPHAISQRCVDYNSCGGFYWTGEYKTVYDCVKCCENASYSLTCSQSSITMRVGETKSVVFTESSSGFTVSMPGQCSASMLSASWGNWVDGCKKTMTFTALKAGTTTIEVQLIASLTGKVVKTYSLPVTINPNTYTIKYDANGGTGAPSSQTKIYGQTLTLSNTKPIRNGYTFLGWSTSSTATSATYSAGGSYTSNSEATLYAIWKKNHIHSYTSSVTKQPTCTQTGIKTYTCSCGNSYTETISGTGHKFGNWSTTKAATCTIDGTKTRKCSFCGKTETQVIPKTSHNYTTKVVAPTCTSQGYTLHTCSKCRTSYKDTYKNAKGHSFGEWSTTKSSTCTTDGKKTRKCSSCGKTETQVIPKTSHNYTTRVVAPTCTAQGYTLHTCLKCGTSYKDTYKNTKGHSFGAWTITRSATSTAEGTKTRKCAVCSKTETQIIAKTGYYSEKNLKQIIEKKSNFKIAEWAYEDFDGDGTKEAFAIIGEKKYISDKNTYVFVWFINHKGETTQLKRKVYGKEFKSYCTYYGNAQVFKQDNKRFFSFTSSMCAPSTGFIFGVVNGKPKEFKISGKYKGFEFENGKLFANEIDANEQGLITVKNELIYDNKTNELVLTKPAHIHKYIIKTVVKPTYTAQGYTLHKCSVCGASYKDNYKAKLVLGKVSKLKASSNKTNSVKLSWNKVSGASGYYVYQQKNGKWSKIKTTKSTSYTVPKLKSGTTYKFAIKAYKTSNSSAITSASYSTVTTSTKPATVNLKLTAGSKKATVKWNKVTGATGYKVYYKTSKKGSWKLLKTTGSGTTSYTKTGLTKGKTYYFTVKAVRTTGGKTYNGSYNAKSVKVK